MGPSTSMTSEEMKKQQELDSRAFQDLSTEEKIVRLVRVIKDLERSFSYSLNRIASLEQENNRLKNHEHNQNGDVVIKINNHNNSLGMVSGNQKLVGKSLLD